MHRLRPFALPALTALNWEHGAPVEVAKARLSELRSFGHKLERFLAARATVHRRIHRTPELGALVPWVRVEGVPPSGLVGDGTFATVWSAGEGTHQVLAPLLPQASVEHVLPIWRQVDPEAPKNVPAPLTLAQDLNEPVWGALLRLRPLRPVWESVLRRDHYESLLSHLPDAWLLDPTPLPPGAVIPRLEVPSWRALLSRREAQGPALFPSLTITATEDTSTSRPKDSTSASAFATDLDVALAAFPGRPHLLVQTPQTPGNDLLISFYEKKGTRVDHRGRLSLSRTAAGGWSAARVRTK